MSIMGGSSSKASASSAQLGGPVKREALPEHIPVMEVGTQGALHRAPYLGQGEYRFHERFSQDDPAGDSWYTHMRPSVPALGC